LDGVDPRHPIIAVEMVVSGFVAIIYGLLVVFIPERENREGSH